MLLSDHLILRALDAETIKIYPLDSHDLDRVQPASIDIRLGFDIVDFIRSAEPLPPIDPAKPDGHYNVHELNDGDEFQIQPGQFILASTLERVQLAESLAARIEGKGTLTRLGLIVHSTAGFVDPGFKGQLTLAITNINYRPIILRPRMLIAQLSFTLIQPPDRPYGAVGLKSHYQNQVGATPAEPLG